MTLFGSASNVASRFFFDSYVRVRVPVNGEDAVMRVTGDFGQR